jgi:hypothetical protein
VILRITFTLFLLAAALLGQPAEGQNCTVVNAIADAKAGFACSGGSYWKLTYPPPPTQILTITFNQATNPAVAYLAVPISCSPVTWSLVTGLDGAASADILAGGTSLVQPNTTVRLKARLRMRRQLRGKGGA